MKIWGIAAIVYVLVPVGVALELGTRALAAVVLLPFDVLEELDTLRWWMRND